MAGFLYYVSGHRGAMSLSRAHDLGLGGVLDSGPSCADVEGPDGKWGTILAELGRPDPPPLGFSAHTQVWRKLPTAAQQSPAAQAWVGMVTAAPPTPSILQRPAMLRGRDVQLADGHPWTVPHARQYVADSGGDIGWCMALPRYLDVSDDGRCVEGGVQAKYQALWDAAERFTEHIGAEIGNSDGNSVTMDLQSFFDDAITCLAANYYVGPAELGLLKALTFDHVNEVMLSLIDWYNFDDLMSKKKHSDTLSSADGSAAATTATPPRLAS